MNNILFLFINGQFTVVVVIYSKKSSALNYNPVLQGFSASRFWCFSNSYFHILIGKMHFCISSAFRFCYGTMFNYL